MEQSYLSDVTAALASRDDIDRVFEVVSRAFQNEVGFRLLTVTAILDGSTKVRRLWSSNCDLFPIGGTKLLGNEEWNHIVIQQQKPVVCDEPLDVRRMFADHEDIARLDCGAGVNLPVILRGSVIGSVNIFHEPHWFTATHLARANALLALLYAPMILAMDSLSK